MFLSSLEPSLSLHYGSVIFFFLNLASTPLHLQVINLHKCPVSQILSRCLFLEIPVCFVEIEDFTGPLLVNEVLSAGKMWQFNCENFY
jgi:hypothetical protein